MSADPFTDPFTEGYAEQILLEADTQVRSTHHDRRVSFDDFTEEAVLRIIRDCIAVQPALLPTEKTRQGGATFWKNRTRLAASLRGLYPPQEIVVDEAGRVHLREVIG